MRGRSAAKATCGRLIGNPCGAVSEGVHMRINARAVAPTSSKGPRRAGELKAMNVRMQALSIDQIKLDRRNARTHSAKQIRQLANSIIAFGFINPLLVNEDGTLVAGEGRYKAAQLLGLTKVPVIVLSGLSFARQRALAIADNKIAENAGWDRGRLAIEIPELAGLLEAEGLDVSILGFEAVEIDQLVTDFEDNVADPQDGINPGWLKDTAVSKPGDLWGLGSHRLLCGDARSAADIARLMADCRADMAFPPYNVRIDGVVGRGRTKHSEFAMASGEMPPADYVGFLRSTLNAAASVSREGALHYVCTDWRHIAELLAAAKPVYGDTINIAVWVKSNAGQAQSRTREAMDLLGDTIASHTGVEHQVNIFQIGLAFG
jgi:hypothetical protein